MSELHTLLTGIAFGESPRWHEGRLWFADWGRGEIVAVDPAGTRELVLTVPGQTGFAPACIDWLPDGRLLVLSGPTLYRQEPDDTLVVHADLRGVYPAQQWNDIAVDRRGNIYVNNIAFAFPGGEFVPGIVAVVTPDGEARVVAEGFAFPNGMAVSRDDSTLIVAESYSARLTGFDIEPDGSLSRRRAWAELPEGAAPDGICVDAEDAVWYGDVPNRSAVRVAEGGEVLQTVHLDRGCFATALGDSTLYLVATQWPPVAEPTGQILTLDVAVSRA